jgi:hypothetical protein
VLVHWEQYLAPLATKIVPVAPHTFMMIVGVIEIVTGLIVAVSPQVGAHMGDHREFAHRPRVL